MDDFKEACFQIREGLKEFEGTIRALLRHRDLEARARNSEDWTEMPANITLALRHLEDCRMRLGKAIQAFDGGTSVYPR